MCVCVCVCVSVCVSCLVQLAVQGRDRRDFSAVAAHLVELPPGKVDVEVRSLHAGLLNDPDRTSVTGAMLSYFKDQVCVCVCLCVFVSLCLSVCLSVFVYV